MDRMWQKTASFDEDSRGEGMDGGRDIGRLGDRSLMQVGHNHSNSLSILSLLYSSLPCNAAQPASVCPLVTRIPAGPEAD